MLQLKVKTEGGVRERLMKLYRDYRDLGSKYVAIGWDAHAGKYPGGQPVALVALINEYGSYNSDGSVRSPERPFMRPAYQKNRPAIDALRTQVVQKITDGKMTPTKALDTLGYRMQLYIQAKIKANPDPPLAARTVRKKRDAGRPAVTLIDTRRMLDTLTYRIYTGLLGKGEQTQAAKGLQQQSAFASARLNANAQARVDKMRSARQIKAEKQRLRDDLKAAKAQVRADFSRARKVMRTRKRRSAAVQNKGARNKIKRDAAREAKATAASLRKERIQQAKDFRRARRSSEVKGAIRQGIRNRVRPKRRSSRSTAASRSAAVQAKASHARLVKANKLRAAKEKAAERKEAKAEGRAKTKQKQAKQKAKVAAKKKVKTALNRFLTQLEKGPFK